MSRAQSTIEYLAIIGAVITIALIATALITNFFGFFGPVSTMQNKQEWGVGSIAILEAIVDNNGDALIVMKNNLLHPIYFAGYSIGSKQVLVDEPMIFLPEEKKTVFIPNIGDCEGECSYSDVFFHYQVGNSESIFDSGGFDLMPGKKSSITSGTLFFEGASNSLICIEANNVQECLSTQPDLSGYVTYTGATTDVNLGTNGLTTTGTGMFGEISIGGDVSFLKGDFGGESYFWETQNPIKTHRIMATRLVSTNDETVFDWFDDPADGIYTEYGLYTSYLNVGSDAVELYNGTEYGLFTDGFSTLKILDGTQNIYSVDPNSNIAILSDGSAAGIFYNSSYKASLGVNGYAGYLEDGSSNNITLADGTYAVNATGMSQFNSGTTNVVMHDGTYALNVSGTSNFSDGANSVQLTDNTYAVNATGGIYASGDIQTGTSFKSSSGNQGIDDTSSYWLCTASDCSTTCQVSIESGIITGCT